MLTINSDGFEISIVGCVEEMVCHPTRMHFFILLFLLFLFLSCVHCFEVQEASCSTSYGKNKTYKSKQKNKRNYIPRSTANLKITWPKPNASILAREKNIWKLQHANKNYMFFA